MSSPAAEPVPARLGWPYLNLWSAATVSALGDGMSLSAAPLLASSLTHDPRLIAGVTVALTAPFALFGLPAGVLVDRLDRRRSMACVDAFRFLVLSTFAVLVLTGHAGLISLYVCFFLVGTAETFYRNASQALVPQVVDHAVLIRANSRLMAAQTAGNQFAGTLAGAALFVIASGLPFAVDSLTFLASAVLLSVLRLRPGTGAAASARPRQSQGSGWWAGLGAEMTTGARWLWRHDLLRELAGTAMLINFVSGAALAVLVVYAHDVIGVGNVGYGVLLATEAAGAVAGAWVAPAIIRALGKDWTLVVVVAALVAAYLLIWQLHWPVVAGVALGLAACASVTWDVIVVALRQTLIPENLQGRVNSVYRLLAWGSLPIGAGAAGLVSRAAGTPAVYGLGAAVLLVPAVRVARGAQRKWITENETTLEQIPT